MTLIDPGFFTRYKKHIAIGIGGLVLLGAVLWGFDAFGDWRASRDIQKAKDAIANNVETIKAANADIANAEARKIEAQANINAVTKDYANAVFGREQAKEATNQALANLANAVSSNANIDRSAEDLERVLRELEDK